MALVLCTEAAACSRASAMSCKTMTRFLVVVYPDGRQSTKQLQSD